MNAETTEYCVNTAERQIREGVRTADHPSSAVDSMNYRVVAVEAFRRACPHRFGRLCDYTYQLKGCRAECEYAKRFTHCLDDLIRKMND